MDTKEIIKSQYHIRHLQHHIGELCERLGTRENVEVDWITMRS
jgi:hypothetical protein